MPKILVVDDIATNRDVLVTLLGYYGHHLIEASSGVEGLKLARAEGPDLIIADVLMPTMDGYEFVRQLRLDRQLFATPVVFYTAHYLEREARELAATCSVSLIIAKPSEPQEVLRVVDLALRGHEGTESSKLPEVFDREHLRLLTDKVAEKSATLRAANQRLGAVIQLGQSLATEQNPDALVQRYCHGAREILGAGFAGVWLSANAERPARQVFYSGVEGKSAAQLDSYWHDHPVIQEVLESRGMRWVTSNSAVSPTDPDGGEPVFSLLAVPVFSGATTLGWLGLWNKVGGDGFTEEEADVAVAICAQLAVTYENALLTKKLQAANLQLESRVEERTRELAAANIELSRSNSELEQYAFSASHDLQEPLRMISIFSALLLKRYRGNLDSDGEMYLERIEASAAKMRLLIDDLLTYSKLVVDQEENVTEAVALMEAVEAAKANCAQLIEENGAVVTCEPLRKVRVKSDLLVQVFQNLISNAIRYRRPEVTPVVSVTARLEGGEYIVAVEDNGIGVPMEFAEYIFRLFKRLERTDIPGTGIGLAICKRVVEAQGGRIWVHSRPNEGATFYVALPETVVEA